MIWKVLVWTAIALLVAATLPGLLLLVVPVALISMFRPRAGARAKANAVAQANPVININIEVPPGYDARPRENRP